MEFLKKYWFRLTLITVINRFLLVLIGVISIEAFAPYFQKPREQIFAHSLILAPWGGWDTGVYLQIVSEGYVSPDGNSIQIGWFPFYPILTKMVSLIISNAYISALIVSNLCFLATIFLLGSWLAKQLDEKIAFTTSLFLIFFPSSMVLSGAFSEALFLMLLVATYCLMHKKYILYSSAAFGFLLITRPVAIALTPLYIFLVYRLFNYNIKLYWRTLMLTIIIISLPFLIYTLYLWHLTGDIFAYIHNKEMYHHHEFTNPFLEILDAIQRGITEHRFEHAFNAVMILFATFIVFWNRKKMGWPFIALGLTLIYFPLFTGAWMLSSTRYLAVTLPIFSGLALFGERYSCTELLFMVCLLLQGIVMVIWSTGGRFLC